MIESKESQNSKPDRQELKDKLLRKLAQKRALEKLPPSIRSDQDRTVFPLSNNQQRMWFLHTLDRDDAYNNLATAAVLHGELDEVGLQHAFELLAKRHEALRTRFKEIDGIGHQIVDPEAAIEIRKIELRAEGAGGREDAEKLARDEARRPFDLASGPLLRVTLGSMGPRCHVVIVVAHHIICDGWSIALLIREFCELYNQGAAAAFGDDPEPKLEYADFAAWQNERRRLGVYEPHLEYWHGQLDGKPELLDLPNLRPRSRAQSHNGEIFRFSLNEDLIERLRGLASAQNGTLFSVMMTGFQVALAKHSGMQDISVGSPTAGRNYLGLESVVGYFANNLVFRQQFAADTTFVESIARNREISIGASKFEDVPFDQLTSRLGAGKGQSHGSLVQVSLSFQNFPWQMASLKGLEIEQLAIESGFSKLDLSMYIEDHSSGDLPAYIEYSTDLFDDWQIAQFAAHFEAILENAASNPDALVSDIARLPPSLGAELMAVEVLAGSPVLGEEVLLHRLFEEQVRRTPDALAIRSDEGTLSYSELDRRANRLAHHLVGSGVGPEKVVGICLERSPDMIVALLAILKSGSAYLPLDGDLPPERLAYMAQDAGTHCIVTSSECVSALEGVDAALILLDDAADAIQSCPDHSPQTKLHGQNLAYLLYTSGSTGNPKAVMGTHASICNLVSAQVDAFRIGPDSKVAQYARLSFDASVSEIMTALATGAELNLPTSNEILAGENLLRFLTDRCISVVTLPPTSLQSLKGAPLPSVKTLVVAGEACPVELASQWARETRLLNAYGPTEGTVCATIHDVTNVDHTVPIGSPIQGVGVFVLDADMELCPVGVPGEIYLAGTGVARGYRNRPALTAERFVPSPFGTGDRLYRTGDVGKWMPGRVLEFLGRQDRQVKLRGFRIELDEIKSAITQHPEVSEAVVVLADLGRDATIDRSEKPIRVWPSIAEFYVYDEFAYQIMASHESRNDCYRRAFSRVLAGKTVLEVGPGPQAILARLAIEAGAKKVYAVELLEETYQAAKSELERLGLEDRIILLHADARTVELPEKADWCISEIVGSIGGSEGAAQIIDSIKGQLRKPDNILPKRSVTKLAGVFVDEDKLDWNLNERAERYASKIFAEVGKEFDFRVCLEGISRSDVLTDSAVLEDVDYASSEAPDSKREVTVSVKEDARLSGFLVWLNLHIDDKEVLDTLEDQSSWLPMYLPVFDAPVEVSAGDRIELEIEQRFDTSATNPDFVLTGTLHRSAGEPAAIFHRLDHVAQQFRGNAFYRKLFEARDSMAIVQTNKQGLSAYFVGTAEAATIRHHLQSKLPGYMIPAQFHEVSAIPLNDRGKVDLRKLSDLRQSDAPSLPLAGDAELAIAESWSEVLGCGPLGAEANFFALGGDSITSIEVVAACRRRGIKIAVRDIFEAEDLRQLAARSQPAEQLDKVDEDLDEACLAPIQSWLFESQAGALSSYTILIEATCPDPIDRDRLHLALKKVVEKHDALQLKFAWGDGEWSQETVDDLQIAPALELGMDEAASPISRSGLAVSQLVDAIDPEEGVLIRVGFANRGTTDNVLCLAISHLVCDFVSARIVLDDLSRAYSLAETDKQDLLPSHSVSYLGWSNHIEELADSDAFSEAANHWQETVDTGDHLMPIDRESADGDPKQDTHIVEFSPATMQALVAKLSGGSRKSMLDVLVACAAQAANRASGLRRPVIWVETHGRDIEFVRLDISRTVGWFTSFFPVAVEAGEGHDFSDVIGNAHRAIASAPHDGASYLPLRCATVQSGLKSHRDPGILVNYLGDQKTETVTGSAFAMTNFTGSVPVGDDGFPRVALTIDSGMIDGVLKASLTFSRQYFSGENATAFVEAFRASLDQMQSLDSEKFDRLDIADFPLMQM